MSASHLMQTYAPQPVAFARGEGAWLWDTEGRKYLDGLAGIAVNGLGHAHPVLTKALCEQAGKLIHTSNLFRIPEQERAAAKICALANMDNAFFCNSGAEANECAIKIARLHGQQSGIGRTGKWFAHQWAGIVPDVMPLAKGLGSGVPIGACLARGAAAKVFKPGNHGTTFGGGPLVAVAAITTLEVIEKEGLLANAHHMGEVIRGGLTRELSGVAGVREVRGMGLMIGVELERPCAEVV